MLQQEIDQAVQAALDQLVSAGGYRSYRGDSCDRLAAQLGQRLQTAEVLLTSSGTTAVELALRAAGVGPGDEVLLSAYDYPGNFWAIERVGARPVLLDVEEHSWRIERQHLDAAVQQAPAGRCKALVVSHLHGQLQEIVALRQWCDAREMLLIEDACQAMGADIAGKPAGAHGHVGVLSFGGGKLLSAGRGGALLVSDPLLAQRARIAAGSGSGPQTMSELQAAVILAQWPYWDELVRLGRQYFAELCKLLQTSRAAYRLPFIDQLPQTAFYQAGLLWVRPVEQGETQLAQLRLAGLPAGGGFAGFHRRSARRCRHATPLRNVVAVAQGTWTIHFRVALEGRLSPAQAADLLHRLDP
ncbi:MAG: DegT/DnrJ/EryC1/StrS aminotransferase family protein [Planctomycetales bacterium]|nr:DegT/DnrJ/EryC1/StrS aminotransferase family protein [Planctomycetales bacterium]